MPYTADQLQTLIDLRASGELRRTVGDRTIQFQTGADLDKAIEAARRDVAITAGRPAAQRRYAEHHRG